MNGQGDDLPGKERRIGVVPEPSPDVLREGGGGGCEARVRFVGAGQYRHRTGQSFVAREPRAFDVLVVAPRCRDQIPQVVERQGGDWDEVVQVKGGDRQGGLRPGAVEGDAQARHRPHLAYSTYGQLGAPSLNALLLLLTEDDPEAFIRRSFDVRVPEAVRDRVGQAIEQLREDAHPKAAVNLQWLRHFTTGSREGPLTPTVSESQPASPPGLQPFAQPGRATVLSPKALKMQLRGPTGNLPKATRKAIPQVQSEVLSRVPERLREQVLAGLLYNLFDARTLQAVRVAYQAVPGRHEGSSLVYPALHRDP